jgi:hypothetical protein
VRKETDKEKGQNQETEKSASGRKGPSDVAKKI